MKRFLYIILGSSIIYSCEQDMPIKPENTDSQQTEFVKGFINSVSFYFDDNLLTTYDTTTYFFNSYFSGDSVDNIDSIRLAFFNANLDLLVFPYQFPNSSSIQAGMELFKRVNNVSIKYTLISGIENSSVIINTKSVNDNISGVFSGSFTLTQNIISPGEYVGDDSFIYDTIIVTNGQFSINFKRQ